MRFHMGVSFSWRTIKKFLIPFILGMLAFFGFSSIFDSAPLGFIKVLAYSNPDTSWNLTMQNYDEQLRATSCGTNGTMYDVVNDIIDNTSTDYYTLFVGQPYFDNGEVANITFYIKWKSSISYNVLRYYAYKSNSLFHTYIRTKYSSNTDRIPYYNLKNTTCDNYQNNSDYQMYKYLTDTGDYSRAPSGSLGDFNYNNYDTSIWESDLYTLDSTISNSSSYNVDNWFYYSTNAYTYQYLNPNNNNYFNKSICITDNDTCYVQGDLLPSYYDLHHNDTPEPDTPSFIGYKTSLDSFYTSLLPSNFSNFTLKVNFRVPQSLLGYYQTPQEYIDNTLFNYICSGRVDHSDYYTYESFPCSLTTTYTNTDNTIEYTFNNLTSSSSLSSFDKIYVTINSNYLDSNVSTTVFDLSYTYTLGDFYNTSYKGSIYEKLTSLPLNFRLYFSSNNSLDNSLMYVKKYNFVNYNIKYIGFSNISQLQNLVIGSSILGHSSLPESVQFISTNVTNKIDTGIMIYQKNGAIPVPSLEMFFDGGFILSLNSNLSSNTFYYIDNEGTIQNNNFTISSGENSSNTKYDISYYLGVVNGFIDNISQDSIEFSSLTQTFYNSLPLFFQTFIFVVFILVCVYFTYLLIKR